MVYIDGRCKKVLLLFNNGRIEGVIDIDEDVLLVDDDDVGVGVGDDLNST